MPNEPVRAPLGEPNHVLPRSVLERMHAAGVAMLGATGIRIEHDAIREAVALRDGFTLRDGRILIREDRIASLMARLRDEAPPPPPRKPDAPFTLGTDDRASWIAERDGVTLRPLTRDDVIASAKLITMLHSRGVRGRTAGMPMDVPGPLRPIEQYLIAAEFSRAGGGTSDVLDVATAEAIRALNKASGREGLGLTVWSPSPMLLAGPELDIVWRYRDEVDDLYVGSMPTMGMTGPCDPIGVFTLSAAECLGNAVILHELVPRARIQIGPHPEPVDMASGVMVFGTPEWEVLDLMHRDIHAFYGRREDRKLLHTTASVPDVRAASDHAGSFMLGALHGYTDFAPGGMLGLDEVWSPAMLVLDTELMAHARRCVRGAWSGAGLSPEELPAVVAEAVAAGGVFADHDTTLANMRDQYHRPGVLERMNRAQWERAGRPDEVRAAQAEADRLVASFDYQADPSLLRELRAIRDRARAALG